MSGTQQILQQAFGGDGARSSKYNVLFDFSANPIFQDALQASVLCKAASFPSRQHTPIMLKFKGRTIPIRGQIKYSHSWICTFYCTSDHKLKNAFETWIAALDETIQYDEQNAYTDKQIKFHHSTGYTKDIAIYQISFDETQATAQYVLHNCFPIEITPLQVKADGPGDILEFDVTFAFSHFDINNMKGESGNFISGFLDKLKNMASGYVQNIVGKMSQEIDHFLNDSGINNLADTIADTPDKLVSGLGPEVERLGERLLTGVSDIFPSGSGSFSSTPFSSEAITKMLSGITGSISSAITSATNAAIKAVSEFGRGS